MTPQELKNSILQLAIQGKLVEQRPKEGTGEELFQRLIKHHSDLKPCKDELNYGSMDFEIPEHWRMVELNQLFAFVDYRGKTPTKITEGIFLITASNIRQGYMDYARKEYISVEEYNERQSRGITNKGDLLFTTEAHMGNTALCDLDVCSCGQRIITFKPYEEETAVPALFMYFILSPSFQRQLLDNCTGTTAKGIKADKLKHFYIPLPPLAEQKRIVAKIEELLPLIDRYEKAWSRLEDFNKRFPADMQKSLLQLAIQGKLVEQRPEEGTGEELYEQIKAEKQKLIKEGKIKKEKPLPEITEDEIPFEIPEGWKWVRFSDIASFLNGDRGSNYPKRDEYVSKGVAWINTGHITPNGYLDVSTMHYITEEKYDSLRNGKIRKDDLVYCLRGATFGKIARVEPFEKGAIASSLMIIRLFAPSIREYIYTCLRSPLAYQQLHLYSNGSAQPNLAAQDVAKYIIPLPPIREQERILTRLTNLMAICERL